jgi:hypothetical protein
MQILAQGPYGGPPTTAPTSLSAVPTNVDVAISFTAPSNDGGLTITNYEYSFNNSTWTALSPADAITPVTVGGLTQNTGYTVYLRAVNAAGSGPASTGVSFTTAGVPTGTATISSVTVGTTTATVTFSVAAGGGAITGYDLYVANQTNAWNNTTASPISVTGLTSNSYYVFYVRAKNAYGVGPQSAGVGATTNPTFIVASGGSTVDYVSGSYTYRAHTFTGSSTFTISSAGSFPTVDVLIVAGGGGGAGDRGSGGGGGGFRQLSSQSISATSYTVTVGGGGSACGTWNAGGGSGGNSQFGGLFSTGGGGADQFYGGAKKTGGSGGGTRYSPAAAGNIGGYSPVEGYSGGVHNTWGGGGGGAGSAGLVNTYPANSAGGSGAYNAWGNNSNEYFSPGGNNHTSGTSVNGYYGGGGKGVNPGGQAGAQGKVVVRYRIS